MTKLEIIDETVKFYSENPRSKNGKNCVYNGPNGTHCAVGRCFRDYFKQLGENFQDNLSGVDSLHCDYNGLDKLLDEKYQGHELAFWSDMQHLHDSEHNWDSNGLSLEGKGYVDALIEKYGKSENDEINALAERFGLRADQIKFTKGESL